MKHLTGFFICNGADANDPDVRKAYGVLAGVIGLVMNTILCIAKFVAGAIAGSIAITADAFNNLSDAGSSMITLFGFKLAGQRPHPDHPFGHGRYEYIAGLIMSMLIIMMGFSLAKESLENIIYPQTVEFSALPAAILAVSVLVKLGMCLYNWLLAKRINSVAIRAAATDSLADAVSTAVVLISMLVGSFTDLAIDGYAGALVAFMILWAGIQTARDTISPLLGMAPDRKLVESIHSIVRSCPGVTGVHDLVIHDYGAGRRMISLHAEVPADGDMMATHDAIDLIERRLCDELRCHAVIHMDPLETDDWMIRSTRDCIEAALCDKMNAGITIHDFRMVVGPTHTNVIFDAVLPFDAAIESDAARKRIVQIVKELDPTYNAVVTIDTSFVGE